MKQIFELAGAQADDDTVERFQQEWNDYDPKVPRFTDEQLDEWRDDLLHFFPASYVPSG